jgi:3,4-dihydroxy 2-butanone 4-phosphate synthase/GTP cyclohydrolase II
MPVIVFLATVRPWSNAVPGDGAFIRMSVYGDGMSSSSRSGPSAGDSTALGDTALRRVAQTVLPTEHGTFDVYAYVDPAGEAEHVALVMGDLTTAAPPLVRVHSECLTGDALGSHRCDCGDQLQAAQRAIAAEGRGAVIYLRGHEGRGIGLVAKLQAYALQDGGLDTVDANLALGLPADLRSYRPAADVLKDLGVSRIRLMSSNPAKEEQLRGDGIEVAERIALPVPERPENVGYLAAKRARMGHQAVTVLPTAFFTPEDAWRELVAGRRPSAVADPEAATLIERYGPVVTAGSNLVLAQLGQSLDGFIAARTGDAIFVTGEPDREHLHRLRALVDAVIVGVNTLITDDCRLTVRAVEGPSPVRVLLDPKARAPRTAALLAEPGPPVLWLVADDGTAPEPPAAHVQVVSLPLLDGHFQPATVLAALAARGLGRVLVEGGGRTVSAFLAAGVLDRIYVTTAPLLVGDGIPGLRFAGTDRLADALRAPSRHFTLGEDVCFELDLAAARKS